MITKIEARKLIKEYRSKLSSNEADSMSRCIQEKVLATEDYKYSDVVLIYKSVNNEVDTDMIIEDAISKGKKVALPKVIDKDIIFYQITSNDDLIFGYMGIPEPEDNPYKMIDDPDALLIMPGLAFDYNFNRVGYGGGFYDRYIASHPDNKKIAIAFDKQIFDEIDVGDYDKKVDIIFTDKRELVRGE